MIEFRSSTPGRPLIIGHRGASGEAPENTLAAFRLAVEQGADLVETDVHLTSDGVLVAIHDHTLDRTTDGHGLVGALTLSQIRRLDAGSWFDPRYAGERVPTLDDLLEWAAGRVPVAVEIKNGPIYYPQIEDRIVEALRRHDMIRSAIVISFDHSAVLRAKRLCPDLLGGVLFAGTPVRPSSLALHARADILLPHWAGLTREMVQEAHSRSLGVSPWVVDNREEMAWVLELGVDAIATNHPGRLLALLEGDQPAQRRGFSATFPVVVPDVGDELRRYVGPPLGNGQPVGNQPDVTGTPRDGPQVG